MKTYTLTIRSEDDEQFVLDILNALKSKRIIDLLPLGFLGIEGISVEEEELRNSVRVSEKSASFTLAEAKQYVGI